MTTIQILHRIARHARTGDFTRLSLPERMDCLEALNSALMKGYNALPVVYREQTQGFTLPAPVTLSINATVGSNLVPASTFTQSQIGATVVIPGDANWNQVIGTAELLNPYLGTVSGVQAGCTVYGDSLFTTTYPFDRVIGNPTFSNPSTSTLIIPGELARSEGGWNWLFQNTIGRPQSWWPQYMGNSQGFSPFIVLKFAPLPDTAYAINIRFSFWPIRLLLSDIAAATPLTVPDQFLEKNLIPMARRALLGLPAWQTVSPDDDRRVISDGNAALVDLVNQVADLASPFNRAYCPLGY